MTYSQEQRIKLGEGGRVVIPALLRKELGIGPGDELLARVQDGELRLFQQGAALTRIRAAVRRARGPKNVVEDFLAFRRADDDA